MSQKVIKIGTSIGFTISKDNAAKLGLKPGDAVETFFNAKNGSLEVKPVVASNDEVIEWTKGFMKRYRPALKELSNK